MTNRPNVNVGRALFSGMAAGTAYLGSMWLDNRLSSHKFDDIKLVGQMFTTRSPLWQIQGVVGHFGFSVVMALVYASQMYRRLPGPGWLRGLIFLQIENSLLYPFGFLLDPRHAGMKSGQLPRLLRWKTFWGQVLRHVTFGVTLGALYRDKG